MVATGRSASVVMVMLLVTFSSLGRCGDSGGRSDTLRPSPVTVGCRREVVAGLS